MYMGKQTILVYDFDLKRPACPILQAVSDCDNQSPAFHYFDAEDWLITPTPGMRKVAGTDEEWRKAAAITRKHRSDKCPNT
jgi:hypothetical protein